MMLAHRRSARDFVFLVAFLLAIFLLTAYRLHISPAAFSHVTESWTTVLMDNQEETRQDDRPGSPYAPAAGRPNTRSGASDNASVSAGGFCVQDFEFLRQPDLALTENILYTRRCIRPVRGDVDRDTVTDITGPLISGTTTLNLTAECPALNLPPCEPLLLHVPRPYPQQQHPHLLFGVASSYERLNDSVSVFAHWLSGTGAQLVAVVSDADRTDRALDLAALQAAYHDHDILATVIPPRIKHALLRKDTPPGSRLTAPAPVEQLHFLLIRDMIDHATPQTQWLGVVDDDTFFPAIYPVSQALRQHDHTARLWLGALADNFQSIQAWGYMAFGGAGVFLSVPFANQLNPYLEACLHETTVLTGDGMLRDCIYAHTTTKLTLLPGLSQHDIRGDPSGIFESGRHPLLSMHHWKSWYHAPVDKMARVARVCGDCFLQRWRFGADTLLANGYSVSVYRGGLLQQQQQQDLDSVSGVGAGLTIRLDRVEATWQDAEDAGKFGFVYGPVRPRLGPEAKKSYRLAGVDGTTESGGRFRQVYVHRAPREEAGLGDMDEVVELIWEG